MDVHTRPRGPQPVTDGQGVTGWPLPQSGTLQCELRSGAPHRIGSRLDLNCSQLLLIPNAQPCCWYNRYE